MSEIATMSTIQQKVSEKIKSQFLELIPDEAFAQMVEKELKAFTEDKPGDRWTNTRKSPLSDMIELEIKNQFQAKVRSILSQPEFQAKWDNHNRVVASDAVTDLLKKSAPDILALMIGTISQQIVENFRNSLHV